MNSSTPDPRSRYPEPVLVVRAAAGDAASLAELVRRNLAPLRNFLRRLGAPPDLADDLAQDALLVALERIGDCRGDGTFLAWVRRIAARRYLRILHSSGRVTSMDLVPEAVASMPDAGSSLDLDAALQSLPEAQRLCVTLQHGAGYTASEIARALDLPEGTVKSHVTRGLARLRRYLGSET